MEDNWDQVIKPFQSTLIGAHLASRHIMQNGILIFEASSSAFDRPSQTELENEQARLEQERVRVSKIIRPKVPLEKRPLPEDQFEAFLSTRILDDIKYRDIYEGQALSLSFRLGAQVDSLPDDVTVMAYLM